MFGWGGAYRYGECADCGTLQLVDVPADLGIFYPGDYYSLAGSRDRFPIRQMKYLRAKAGLRGWNRLSAALGFGRGMPNWTVWIRRIGIGPEAAICDVGCGSGDLLADMAQTGYRNTLGLDPFLPSNTKRDGIPLLATSPAQFYGKFDLVMANHVFEHMPDPHKALESLLSLMKSSGTLLIRVPVADSAAWRRYGAEWVGLDAPRHLYVFTETAMYRLAGRHDVTIWHAERDSTELQFIGSELYSRGRSLMELANTPRKIPTGFSRRQVRQWKKEAAQLNQTGQGDSASFYISFKGN